MTSRASTSGRRPASRFRPAMAALPLVRRQGAALPRRRRRRAELVRRVQRAHRSVGALLRALHLLRHAHRRRARRARPADRRCAAAAIGPSRSIRPRRLHERAQLPDRRPACSTSSTRTDGRASGMQPDRFYYDQALRMIERERGQGPMFIFVYLAANHFPWTYRFRPDLTPDWKDLGNAPAGRRIPAAAGHERARLCRASSRASQRDFPARIVPAGALRRSSAAISPPAPRALARRRRGRRAR